MIVPYEVYFHFAVTTLNHTSEQNQLRDNLTILQAVNFNLTNINDKLNSAVNNLTVQLDNLNKSYADLESNNTDVIAENQKLKTQNQQLETQKKNLTDMLQHMETERNELNVSRAQWSIDQYCPIVGAGTYRTHELFPKITNNINIMMK